MYTEGRFKKTLTECEEVFTHNLSVDGTARFFPVPFPEQDFLDTPFLIFLHDKNMVSLEIDSQPDVPKGLTLYIILSYNVNNGNYIYSRIR